jgi:hypothetical protein
MMVLAPPPLITSALHESLVELLSKNDSRPVSLSMTSKSPLKLLQYKHNETSVYKIKHATASAAASPENQH